MIEPGSDIRSDNPITTAALSFDNNLVCCHYRYRRGGMEVTMRDFTLATRCGGPRSAARVYRDSISSGGSSFATLIAVLRQSPSSSGTPIRHAAAVGQSVNEMRARSEAPNDWTFLIQKVLRFWQVGRRSSHRLLRINSDSHFGNSLAVKGDALIHGPCLVARPVGSEWRTRRPYQGIIQTK